MTCPPRALALRAGLFLWLFLACWPGRGAERLETIHIVSAEWPGYAGHDGHGLTWDIMRLVFEPAGVAVEHRTEVYTRGVGLVQRGKADAWLGAYGHEGSLPAVFLPRLSYGIAPVVALRLSATPTPTLADLGRYRLTWVRGDGYQHHLLGLGRYEEVERRNGVLQMLERDRADFYIDALPGVEALLATTEEPYRYRITTLTGLPLFPGFADTPRGRALAALYDRRMAEIGADGSLRALYARWKEPYLFERYGEHADVAP